MFIKNEPCQANLTSFAVTHSMNILSPFCARPLLHMASQREFAAAQTRLHSMTNSAKLTAL